MRSLVFTSLAVGMLAVACAPKSKPASPAASSPPAAAARRRRQRSRRRRLRLRPQRLRRPQPRRQRQHQAAILAAAANDAAGGRGGRGRGNPPPPPTPPPAVMPAPVKPIVSATIPTPDPRVGLSAGRWDAAQAAWNIRMISTTPPGEKFLGVTNSDLAFSGKYAIQGNYNGFQMFDISNPEKPKLVLTYLCPASQSDVSVYKNLLFVSGEGQTGRVDCGIQGVPEPVSKERLRGIRIFDITNIDAPKNVVNVQTCRGSHTHTVVTDPKDKNNVYIYVSGSAGVRSADELPGCKDGPIDDPTTARFRLEVIKVPLAAPQTAAIISSPRIFYGLAPPPRRVEPGRGGDAAGAGAAGAGAAGAGAAGAGAAAGGAAAGGAAAGGTRLAGAAAAGWRQRRRPAADAATPVRISATTSRSIRTSVSPAARAAATACCSTSATSPTRSASIRRPTSTCRSGTRPRSATTAPRSCSPTSGAADRSRAAATRTSSNGAPTRCSPSRRARCTSRATTRCRRRRRRSRTASRTTAR